MGKDPEEVFPEDKKRSKKAVEQDASKETSKSTKEKNQELRNLGEEMACHYLGDNEIEVLERNWKCKSGTADIIAVEDDTLVFFDVKTRAEGSSGLPEYAVTAAKRSKYEKIAVSYLMENQRPSGRVRFDVIAVQMTGHQQCLLRHHRDAFSGADERSLVKKTNANTTPSKKKQPKSKETKPTQKTKKAQEAVR